jgi:hypothetical protein
MTIPHAWRLTLLTRTASGDLRNVVKTLGSPQFLWRESLSHHQRLRL